MASIQKSLTHAAAQLRDLSLSQRLAIGLGILLVAASVAWLTQWAAVPEMVPLLDQDLSAEELAQIRSGLELLGQPHRTRGARILVPVSADRPSLLAFLQQAEKLPDDTSTGFSALIRESSPWISQEESNRRWTVALKTELERVLRQMAGVKSAYVFLNLNGRERGFSREQPAASASVTLAMKSAEPVPRGLALAAARLVAGAVRGLPLRNVEVLDGSGRVALDWEAEGDDQAPGLHRLRVQQEREIEQKIVRLLDFDPKVRVKVQVVLDHTSRRVESSEPIDGVTISETTSESVTSAQRPGGQPGVEPNVAIAAGTAGGGGEMTRTETRETQLQPGMTTTALATPAGGVQKVFAAVSLSHSYLLSVLKRQQPDVQEISEEQIQQVFERQKARIQNQVSKLVQPPEAEQVAVDWYYDTLEEPAAAAAASNDGPMELARRYGPASGLALLALLSMGLMLRMASRSNLSEAFRRELGLPREAIEAAQQPGRGAQRSDAAAVPAGDEAVATGAPAGAVLEAAEVDESAVQVQAMLEQLARNIESDPGGAAALLSQWMQERR